MKFKLNGKVEHLDNSCYWFLNDQLHREDGPAIERANSTKEWYLNGIFMGYYQPSNWDQLVDLVQVKLIMES